MVPETIRAAATVLKKAKSILFITGAGISADSGLPTYRGIGGLYNDDRTEEGMPIEQALSVEVFRESPRVTWKYLCQIELNCRMAKFNRGHAVIAEIEQRFERVWVLTQNIDGFHLDAGSRNIIEIHGNLRRLYCPGCGWKTTVRDYSGLLIPPRCPSCAGYARPEVVLFNEQLPYEASKILSRELSDPFDLYFSIGTTSIFPYIQQPVIDARERGRPVIEINPGQTAVSRLADIKIALGAAESLDAIRRLL